MDHPQLSRTDMIIPFADGPDGRAAVDAWRAHVEAGRIGRRPPPDPALVAKKARMADLLGRRAVWRPHPEDAQ